MANSTESVYDLLNDDELANAVRMLTRSDLMHEAVVCAARDRIKKLSAELTAARQQIAGLRALVKSWHDEAAEHKKYPDPGNKMIANTCLVCAGELDAALASESPTPPNDAGSDGFEPIRQTIPASYCPDMNVVLDSTISEPSQDTPALANNGGLLEVAWGIIANVNGGDWSRESPEWREAAVRFRDRYHAWLAKISI